MARTRRQVAAAPSPEPPREEGPSSGDEDDADIPAATTTGTRGRPDPYDVPGSTMRVPRPNLLLKTKKKRDDATTTAAQPESNSASDARKRRRGPSTWSSSAAGASKRAKRAEVNPVALDIINSLNKRKRAAGAQGERGPNMRSIAVELPQRSVRSSVSRTGRGARTEQQQQEEEQVEEEEVEGEEQADDIAVDDAPVESDEEQLEAQLQDQVRQGLTRAEPDDAAEIAAQAAAEPDVEQSDPAGLSERDAAELPPRSGQGELATQLGTQSSSQRTARKSRPRVPKVTFSERPPVEEPVRRMSKASSSALRSSQEPQAAAAAKRKPSLGTQHMKDLFQNDISSPRRATTQEPILLDDSESEEEEEEEGEEDDGEEGSSSDESAPDTSAAGSQVRVNVRVTEVNRMSKLIGRKEWTDWGRQWAQALAMPDSLEREGLLNTEIGKRIRNHVMSLHQDYKSAPQNQARQNKFLPEKCAKTEKNFAAIAHLIDKKLCDKHYEMLERGESWKSTLKEDIIRCIIPLLVLLLRDFFFLGGYEADGDGNRELLEKGGDFTLTALQLLIRTSSWICRLAGIIRREAESITVDPTSDEEEGTAQPKSSGSRKQPKTIYEALQEKAKRRIQFHDKACSLQRKLQEARQKLDENINKEARRQANIQRTEQLKAEKAQEEQDALDKIISRREAWEAFLRKTRENGRDPVSDMYTKVLEAEKKRERELAARRRQGSVELGYLDGVREEPVSTAKKWSVEEDQFLLKELKAGGAPDYEFWAETLQCRLDEVRMEVKQLKISAKASAEEKGVKVPAWALTPDH